MIEMAGDDVDVPEELLKMVDEDATEEEGKDSIMGQFQNLQNMDMDQLKEKASATVTELKSKAEEKCSVMQTGEDEDEEEPVALVLMKRKSGRIANFHFNSQNLPVLVSFMPRVSPSDVAEQVIEGLC